MSSKTLTLPHHSLSYPLIRAASFSLSVFLSGMEASSRHNILQHCRTATLVSIGCLDRGKLLLKSPPSHLLLFL